MRYSAILMLLTFCFTISLYAEEEPPRCENVFTHLEMPTNRGKWLVDTQQDQGPEFSFLSWRLTEKVLPLREASWIHTLDKIQTDEDSGHERIHQFISMRAEIYGFSEAELRTLLEWLDASHGGITQYQKTVIFDWIFCQFSSVAVHVDGSVDECISLEGERWDQEELLSFLIRIGNRRDLVRFLDELRLFPLDIAVYRALIPPPAPRSESRLGRWLRNVFKPH